MEGCWYFVKLGNILVNVNQLFFMFNIYLYFKGNIVRICDFECSLYFCDEEIGQMNRDGKFCIVNGRVMKVYL